MKQQWITGIEVYHAVVSGAQELVGKRQHLNKINVFPVPDGDTGTNLAATVQAMISQAQPNESVHVVAGQLAEGALSGARGNSGMIFAQFISGWHRQVAGQHRLSPSELVESLQLSVPYAYEALVEPVEGTILTLIREWVAALADHLPESGAYDQWFEKALAHAREVLQRTPEQLKVLRDSGVVDSGAMGFVHFVEGVFRFVTSGQVQAIMRPVSFPASDVHKFDGGLTYRYCVEGLIEGAASVHPATLKSAFQAMGDSLIVAGGKSRMRLHIHTNDPEEFFYQLRQYGTILQQKVDDMKRQMDVVKNRRSSVAIVTDSIADIPRALLDQLQIHVLPMQLTIQDINYIDKVTISASRFYELNRTAKEQPTSSLPSLKQIENTLAFLLSHYEHILVLSVSGKLSGTAQAVRNMIAGLGEQERIRVIDTRKNSGAQGLLVIEAAEWAASGKDIYAIEKHIQAQLDKTRILVSVETIKYAVRGGRVSKPQGVVAKLLNLKPIMSLDREGRGIAFGKAFSYKQNVRKVIREVRRDHGKSRVRRYCIVHGDCPEKANRLAEEMIMIVGKKPEYVARISPVVGASAGEGAAAVCYIVERGSVYGHSS